MQHAPNRMDFFMIKSNFFGQSVRYCYWKPKLTFRIGFRGTLSRLLHDEWPIKINPLNVGLADNELSTEVEYTIACDLFPCDLVYLQQQVLYWYYFCPTWYTEVLFEPSWIASMHTNILLWMDRSKDRKLAEQEICEKWRRIPISGHRLAAFHGHFPVSLRTNHCTTFLLFLSWLLLYGFRITI